MTKRLIEILHGWRDDCPVRHSEAEFVIASENGNKSSSSERCVRCVDVSSVLRYIEVRSRIYRVWHRAGVQQPQCGCDQIFGDIGQL